MSAAGAADDDVPAFQRRAEHQRLGDRHQLIQPLDLHDTRLFKRRAVKRLVARQGAGVRAGRPLSGSGTAALEDDHRLLFRRSGGGANKVQAAAGPQPLQIDDNDLTHGIVRAVVNVLMNGDVRLVSKAHETAEAGM